MLSATRIRGEKLRVYDTRIFLDALHPFHNHDDDDAYHMKIQTCQKKRFRAAQQKQTRLLSTS